MFRINIHRPGILKLLAIPGIILLAAAAAPATVMPRVEGAHQDPSNIAAIPADPDPAGMGLDSAHDLGHTGNQGKNRVTLLDQTGHHANKNMPRDASSVPHVSREDAISGRFNPGDRGARSSSVIVEQPVFFDCSTVSEIPVVECEALVALYNSTDGPNWSDSDGWLGNTTPCNWFGVSCSEGHVHGMILSNNKLTGNIPPEFGNLVGLQILWLDHNQLRGTIPPEFGNLASLFYLLLHENELTGNIPPELGTLTSLQHLNLSSNQLTGSIPISFTTLDLTSFWFSDTALCEPPDQDFQDWLDGIHSVQSTGVVCGEPPVSFDCSTVSQIPIVECEALVALYDSTDGPNWDDSTGWLGNTTPCNWYGVTCLEGQVSGIILFFNQLTGNIPPELSNLASLQELDLFFNQLSGSIPPELSDLASLQILSLSGNQLIGSIPPDLGHLASLQTLQMSSNQLTGSISPELGNLASLEVLGLDSNQLTGSIPPELGNLVSLRKLGLSSNQLTGSIPTSFVSQDLTLFWFNDTELCEPPDQAFQDWLAGIDDVRRTGVVCGIDSGAADLSIAKAAITNVTVGDNIPDDPSGGLAVNQTTNRAYIYNQAGNTASVIDGVTRTVIGGPIPLGTGPIEDDDLNQATNKIYAVSPDDETVFVIDGVTNAVTPVPVGTSPDHAFADGVNPNFFLTDSGTEPGSVYVISGATDSVAAIIPVGTSPTEIDSNSLTNQLYVINEEDATISVIDGVSNTVVATIPVETDPNSLAVDSINDKVYVTNEGSGTVSVIDGTSNTLAASIPVGLLPSGTEVNPDTNQVYVLNQEDSSVSILDGNTDSLITTLPVGLDPDPVGLNLITNQFYVLNLESESVSIVDGNSLSVSNVAVGPQPVELVINQDLNLVYVTNGEDNTVSVIDGSTGTLVGSFPTGDGPGDIAINQQTNDVYIANSMDNRVTILPGSVVAGASLPYVLPVTNHGPDPATGVVVTDTLPSGVVFDAGNSDPSCAESTPGTVICNLGGLASGATVNFNIGVSVDAGLPGGTLLVNTATVAGNEDDPDEQNNAAATSTSVQVPASGLQAEPSFTLHQDPTDGATGVKMGIIRVFDPATGNDESVVPDEVQARLSYDPGCLDLREIRETDFAISDINIDNPGGLATFTATAPVTGTAPATGSAAFDLGHALTRLVGDNQESCSLTMEISSLTDLEGNPITATGSPTLDFRRGDARADGTVNIADALYIAQYLEGLRPACTDVVDTSCLHSVNAASISQDGDFDQKTIDDANFVAQYLLGLRDGSYDLVPPPEDIDIREAAREVLTQLGKPPHNVNLFTTFTPDLDRPGTYPAGIPMSPATAPTLTTEQAREH